MQQKNKNAAVKQETPVCPLCFTLVDLSDPESRFNIRYAAFGGDLFPYADVRCPKCHTVVAGRPYVNN